VDLNHVVEETLLLMEKDLGKGGITIRRSLTRTSRPFMETPTPSSRW